MDTYAAALLWKEAIEEYGVAPETPPFITSRIAAGAAVPIPTKLLAASIDNVLLSILSPFNPPVSAMVVSFANVHASALAVTVSPEALPSVVLPSVIRLPSISNESSVWSWFAAFLYKLVSVPNVIPLAASPSAEAS